ncbi:hypothetical protein GCM10007939_09430 [Amylibacter marinus]|uniref:Aminoglycoside phosphotransferase domain-containing protein n=1 Tax=Amylibacter marinus TaxID=1475483 RepID=A0ABQ5VTQ6_9RHOB|nr:aminoglycoside phosphotransferase family protein [Amylibacter marinus]GLQ34660.1 hypothetical protein GCM10007939_09430 [Amylibacter marinus]
MRQRFQYFLKLTAALKACRKSPLFVELSLSKDIKLVSANLAAARPHFLFRCRQLTTGKEVIVKIILDKSDQSLAKEHEAYQILSRENPIQAGFRYPEVLGFDPDVPCIFMTRVKGNDLRKNLRQNAQLSRPEFNEAIFNWVKTLHHTKGPKQQFWAATQILHEQDFEEKIAALTSARAKETLLDCFEQLSQMAATMPEAHLDMVFCHGDLHDANILFEQGEMYCIDFSEWRYDIPEFDLAKMALASCYSASAPLRPKLAEYAHHYAGVDIDRLCFITRLVGLRYARNQIDFYETKKSKPEKSETVLNRLTSLFQD